MEHLIHEALKQPHLVFLWAFAGLMVCFLFVGRLMEKQRNPLSYLFWAPFGFLFWPLAGGWLLLRKLFNQDQNRL
ncbi:MAG: hypothetical protein P8J32_01275 [bacterium]|nr:hypothetical protein [bacterium]